MCDFSIICFFKNHLQHSKKIPKNRLVQKKNHENLLKYGGCGQILRKTWGDLGKLGGTLKTLGGIFFKKIGKPGKT